MYVLGKLFDFRYSKCGLHSLILLWDVFICTEQLTILCAFPPKGSFKTFGYPRMPSSCIYISTSRNVAVFSRIRICHLPSQVGYLSKLLRICLWDWPSWNTTAPSSQLLHYHVVIHLDRPVTTNWIRKWWGIYFTIITNQVFLTISQRRLSRYSTVLKDITVTQELWKRHRRNATRGMGPHEP